jgi:hypothetical protein
MAVSAGGSNKRSPGSAKRRLTHAETLKRQQQIVFQHDFEGCTFLQIARDLRMGEKEAREAYSRYVRDVAPLVNSQSGSDVVAARLRTVEDLIQQLCRIAACADNDSARVGALRELARAIELDLGLRRSLGLIPVALSDTVTPTEKEWLARQIGQLLRDVGAPVEALARLEQILATDSDG